MIHEIAPITRLTSGLLILAVHPSVRASSLKEFIELAKWGKVIKDAGISML